MDRLKEMLVKPQMGRRMVMVLVAQFIMGFGVAAMKMTLLGTDPFSAMMMALTAKTPLDYGAFCAIGNCSFFVIEILGGRRYIGFGTVANWFLLGYCVMFWSWVFGLTVPGVSGLALAPKIMICLVGIVVVGFSLSLYQSADIGSSPYDSMPLVIRDHLHVPFFAARIFMDAFSVVVCFLAGGVLGIGTLLVMICLGPVADFFNRNVSEKLVEGK